MNYPGFGPVPVLRSATRSRPPSSASSASRASSRRSAIRSARCRFVHVAGTNGKGSTCAMIESGLRAAGLRTGLYTSPHLVEPTERIRIDGVPVTAERFAAAFDRVHAAVERLLAAGAIDLHTTYFETVTAMAFLLFAEDARRTSWCSKSAWAAGSTPPTWCTPELVRHHARRLRPRGVSGPQPRSDRRREGRHPEAGRAGGLRAAARRKPRACSTQRAAELAHSP